MAAISQQGAALGSLLIGFTAFVAGLVIHGGSGMVVALAGLAFLLYAGYEFRRVKSV
jgi:hypothetical protein